MNNQQLPTLPIEIIKDKFYFLISDAPPIKISNGFYFSIDQDLEYQPFYQDFGPLNLSKIYKYTLEVTKILENEKNKEYKYYHLTSTNFKKHTNAILLVCAFQMISLKKTAKEAYKLFETYQFVPFRDAGYNLSTYQCTILDCLKGLQYAMKLGWFDFKTFNLKQYEHYELVQNGDLNWIIPNKFIAFSSPTDNKIDQHGNSYMSPKSFIPLFKKFGVDSVIRLNSKTYKSEGFTENGIKHFDLFFHDGSCPSLEIVQRFLKITECQEIFAVHCKAGLGRTGTLIACYALKHYQFSAAEFIGWIRLCRPGSIIGSQQYYLIQLQSKLKNQGKKSPVWKQISSKLSEEEIKKQVSEFSMKSRNKQKQEKNKEQKGQGQRLLAAKKNAFNKISKKK